MYPESGRGGEKDQRKSFRAMLMVNSNQTSWELICSGFADGARGGEMPWETSEKVAESTWQLVSRIGVNSDSRRSACDRGQTRPQCSGRLFGLDCRLCSGSGYVFARATESIEVSSSRMLPIRISVKAKTSNRFRHAHLRCRLVVLLVVDLWLQIRCWGLLGPVTPG